MLLREVEYARPESVEEAVRLLGAHDGARALAGGQTLVNVMKARAASPEVLVDLADLDELRTIGRAADGALELGAMVTYSELVRSPDVTAARPLLAEVAATIADRQVQNRGTVGGNVCVNDPTNHLPPLFAAMGATFTILGPGGERSVTAEEFFLGVYMTAVSEGDLLTRVTIPALAAGSADAMEGITLGVHGTYLASAAVAVSPGAVRIALGCVAGVPERATAVEQRLAGAELTPENVRAAVAGLGDTLDPPSDVHAPADYRRRLTEVVCERAVLAAATRAKG
ncbi:MAG TPA: xanthine dehydrogenase family protein subunit M [Gaiellales bacterium]